MLTIRLPQSIEKRLEKLVRRTGHSKSFYVREAVIQHLDDLEDIYLAEKSLKRIRSGKDRVIPLDEIMKRYSIEDRSGRTLP
jgi:RHH-type transcriptional regulator, rel operon repressor / antitoxin RelB